MSGFVFHSNVIGAYLLAHNGYLIIFLNGAFTVFHPSSEPTPYKLPSLKFKFECYFSLNFVFHSFLNIIPTLSPMLLII
jgi:hypothetical protein